MIDPVTAKRLAERMKILYGKSIQLKEDLYGFTPPSNLITEKKYPVVSLGILFSELEDIEFYDNPLFWASNEISIEKIIQYRSSLVNAKRDVPVNLPRKNDKLYERIVEASLSVRAVNLEVKLKKILEAKFIPKISSYYGFVGKLDNIKIIDNPKIPNKVENVIRDIKAENAIYYLYKSGFSDYYLSRLFSLGLFGLKTNKKIVPSKWSITAVQSIIEKKILKEHYDKLKKINEYFLFNYKFYGNCFYGILMPGNGKVELIEAILPGSAYSVNNQLIIGRDEESGGYFSLKLSFAEYMRDTKIIGNLIVFRIITEEYKIPLGVWVVREGTKKMFMNKIGSFDNFREALSFLNSKIQKRHNLSVYKLLRYSKIYRQKSILSFI
ncbi:MAG: hypothetical protein QXR54_00790 [Nanopusillaceae archaeon]